MNPEVDHILRQSAGQLLLDIVPLLSTGYIQGNTSLVAFLMLMCAQEYERGAEIRSAENAEMRALFRDIAPILDDTALGTRLSDAGASRDGSSAISALNESNYELRRLLVAAHARIEEIPGKAARNAERDIWNFLKRSADRRLITLPTG